MILASSFFNILYIVLAIFAILALGGLTGREKETKKKKLRREEVDIVYMDTQDPLVKDNFMTYVAGARFYNDPEDLRCFAGFVYFDPEDEVPRVYRNDLKMMGHIPRERLNEYRIWCPGDTYPCVGYLHRGTDLEKYESELKIIKPYNRKYVDREIKDFASWITSKYGYDVRIDLDKYSPILSEDEAAQVRHVRKSRSNEV